MNEQPGDPAESLLEVAEGQSLGLVVCRLALDPTSGRIRHRTEVGIAIRAALFNQLLLQGRLTGGRWPEPVGESTSGDRLGDSVHRAVSERRTLLWKRWFNHVAADVEAATTELVRLELWRPRPGGGFVDAEPGLILEQATRIQSLISHTPGGTGGGFDAASSTAAEAIADAAVALLATGAGPLGGRPQPKLATKKFDEVIPGIKVMAGAGFGIDHRRDAVRGATKAALQSMRSRGSIRSLSG